MIALARWLLRLELRRLERRINPHRFAAAAAVLSRRIDAVVVALEALA